MASSASKPCQMVLATRTTLFAFTVDVDRGTTEPRPVSHTQLTADAGSPPPSSAGRPCCIVWWLQHAGSLTLSCYHKTFSYHA